MIKKFLKEHWYRAYMVYVDIKWIPRKLKIGFRNFKFGWNHPYPFDKVNVVEEFLWMEFCDFMEKYIDTVKERASRVPQSGEDVDHWAAPSKELLDLYEWYKTGKSNEETEASRLFTISENLCKPKFEPIENGKYYQLVANYDRPEFSDQEKAAMMASRDAWIEMYRGNEKRYEENTNRLFALRGFLWD